MPSVKLNGAWCGGTKSTPTTRKRDLMKRATTEASQRYGINGQVKHGKRSPKPVTLAKITMPE